MFEAIGALLVLGFGGHAVLTGAMQIGDLVAFLILTAFLYDPISRLHQLNQLVQDRKSTRLNSSHSSISYAVFCLKKKKKNNINRSIKKKKKKYTIK